MDPEQSSLCKTKEQEQKPPKQQQEEVKIVAGEELQQGKERPTLHVAVQTEHRQTKVRKTPCVMVQVQQQLGMRENTSCVTVTVQQQGDRGRKVPEVTVQVHQQGQMTAVPCVTVQVDQEWESAREVPCVTVKVQQQRGEREVLHPCDTMQVQHQGSEEDIPYDNVNWQHISTYEAAPFGMEDNQQTQNKGGMVVPEKEPQQQNQEMANMIDSEPLGQGGKDSLVKKSFSQQCRWDQNTEQLNLVQLVQSDQKKNMLEEKKAKNENPLHAVSQDGKRTTLYHLSVTEEEKVRTTEQPKEGGNTLNQQQISSDEGATKVTAAEQVKEERQEEQPVLKIHRREAPNYFVAIPITNDQILDKIEDVQEFIFTKEPNLLKALIPVQTMHLTIIVAHLRTEEDLKRAVSALEHSKAKVEALLQGKCLSMTFHGIGQFNNQVIYVKMSEDEQQMLSKIAEAVESSFAEMNVDITGSKDFKPHLTFLKLSKAPALRRKGFRKIPEDLYMEFEDSPFGTEIFSKVDLCAMHKKKQDSGYYHCEYSINVRPTNSQDDKKTGLDGNIPPNDGTYDHIREIPVIGDLVPKSNLKLTENLDGCSATISREENGLNAEAGAKGETFSADRQVCSKLLPELLPANSNALKAKDEEHEGKKLTDGDLGKVEAREKACQQLAINA